MQKLGKSWSHLKEILAKKELILQCDEDIWDDSYYLFACDNRLIYDCRIFKTDPRNEDQADFEDSYKTDSNNSLSPKSLDGIPKIFTIPALDDEACFCQGFKQTFNTTHLNLEWQVDLSWVKMQGIRIWFMGATRFDRVVRLSVGYYIGENWVECGWWGRDIYLTGQSYEYITEDSCVKSMPIPRGLIIRLTYAPSASAPENWSVDCVGHFKLWRNPE
jgi:hypothetical protein